MHLFHINDDMFTGFFYRRRFPTVPGTPLIKTDVTTKAIGANIRVRRRFHFINPRLGAAASLDLNKPLSAGPVKVAFNMHAREQV